jgi:uncharacterized protein (DUF2336 family)
MSNWGSFVGEVEDAVASGDPIKRVDTLRRMTSLFVDQAPNLKEAHVTVFDEVILRLARDLEFKARVELSERLAAIHNAPVKVVRELAFDQDIKVAGPVLAGSSRLAEDDLVAIAHDRGQDHLFALSRRSTLSERVTDILVDRGDQRVVRAVAHNEGARFSERGFTHLMTRARGDDVLQGILKTRRDIPPRQMQELVAIAREKVRETLREEYANTADEVFDAAVDEAAEAAAETMQPTILANDYEAAVAAVRQKSRSSGLVEEDVVDWIKAGQMEEALAAMAHLAGIPVEMVARAYYAAHYDPLLFIVRSIKFGWGSFKLLLTVKAGRQPSSEVIKSAFDSFQQLSVQTAQRVVRFTAVREQAMHPSAA